MAFIVAVISFVAEAVRSVRVSNGASRLRSSSEVFVELRLFIVWFVPVDVLLAQSNALFCYRFRCFPPPPLGGLPQFYLILDHKHLIWFIFVRLACHCRAARPMIYSSLTVAAAIVSTVESDRAV